MRKPPSGGPTPPVVQGDLFDALGPPRPPKPPPAPAAKPALAVVPAIATVAPPVVPAVVAQAPRAAAPPPGTYDPFEQNPGAGSREGSDEPPRQTGPRPPAPPPIRPPPGFAEPRIVGTRPAGAQSPTAGLPGTSSPAPGRSTDQAQPERLAASPAAGRPTTDHRPPTTDRPAPPPPPASAPNAQGYKPYPWRSPTDPGARPVLTVTELTRQIKTTLERGFPRVVVKGEITGYRGPNPRGHAYFSLKDADACIEVKMWASTVARLKFKLRDGMQVVVEGSVDVYEPSGKYSLIIAKLEPAGEGALALAFQQLKEKLAAEGLLGEKRVRPPRKLPFLPRRIGVVTSRTGAALQDFLRVLYQRHPRASVLLCDSRVQGEGAAAQVVSGIERLCRTDVEVIVVTRGGGSVEDLWTFNEELVARAIHASRVPVISAIGHEVDFTIADFVADLRAPTPTAAAQLVVPVLADLQTALAQQRIRLRKAVERRVLEDRQRLHRVQGRLSDPRRVLGQKRLHLSEQAERLLRNVRKALRADQDRHRQLTERLARKHPRAELALRRQQISRASARLDALLKQGLRGHHQKLDALNGRLARAVPKARIQLERGTLAKLEHRLVAAMKRSLADRRARGGQLAATLQAVSPLKVMARGYAVVRDAAGHVVRGAADVKPGDALAIQLAPPAAGGEPREIKDLSQCDEVRVQVVSTAKSPS